MGTQSLSGPNHLASGMSILLGVEHNRSDSILLEQRELAQILEQMGHKVIYAISPPMVIRQLCEQHFDIILLDMPSGHQGANSILSFVTEHSIQSAIILIASDHSSRSLPSSQPDNFPSYIESIAKPFSQSKISHAVSQAITRFAFSHISSSMQIQAQQLNSQKLDSHKLSHQNLQAQQSSSEPQSNSHLNPPHYDYLTGLPCRSLFHDRLKMEMIQSKRYQTGFALMHLNLDRFRRINDSLGYLAGDRLLKLLAQRLTNRLREGDTLSRLNGDEFLLLLPNVKLQASAAGIAEKLMHSFQSPFIIDEQEVYISARLGITIIDEKNINGHVESQALMSQADIAMSKLKHNRQTGYAFYCDSMKLAIPSFSIERDLRLALQNNDCFVQFQPQVSAEDSTLLGVEALIRWRHPERGLIPPCDFIPVAEQSHQIIDVDIWMLHQACRQIKQQFEQEVPPFKLAVNFSTVFIEQSNFVDVLLTTLAKYDFPNQCFELEITESKAFNDMDSAVEKLKRLRRAGIGIAIDDFGVGSAMFNYLKCIPATTLKIDRSFIHDIKDSEAGDSIVDAIVAMALSRNLHIVAEGVETDAQRQYLQKANCHTIQGYLTGKAMSLDKIVSLYCEPKEQMQSNANQKIENKLLKNTA